MNLEIFNFLWKHQDLQLFASDSVHAFRRIRLQEHGGYGSISVPSVFAVGILAGARNAHPYRNPVVLTRSARVELAS